MTTGLHPHLGRSRSAAAVGILALALTGCTGRGGGQLPPGEVQVEGGPVVLFTGPATFGFDFSCEDNSTTLNSPPGQLRIQLSYTDHGTSTDQGGNSLIGSSFSIHGIVDEIDPVVESGLCIGQNPPPEELAPNGLVFLGRYWLTSSAPAGFPAKCPARETETTPLCRFEVFVRDNDMNRAPSPRDWFQIKLSSATAVISYPPDPKLSELDPETVFYTRGGPLSNGNLTVD